jgi:hypothetical protein
MGNYRVRVVTVVARMPPELSCRGTLLIEQARPFFPQALENAGLRQQHRINR